MLREALTVHALCKSLREETGIYLIAVINVTVFS